MITFILIINFFFKIITTEDKVGMMWNLSINVINMSLNVSIGGHYPFQRKHLERLGQLKDAMPNSLPQVPL